MDKLCNISLDKDNGECLCNSEDYLFNYDKIVESVYISNPPFSPDAIHFKSDEIIFIEFKNGEIGDQKHKMQIKLKGIEGAFIALFTLVVKEDATITFKDIIDIKKSFIVVYNMAKNENARGSRVDSIKSHLTARFGLDKYDGTFFRKAITVSEKTFMSEINKVLKMRIGASDRS